MADSYLRSLIRSFLNGRPLYLLDRAAWGYNTGDQVTQATDKTTAFTLNAVTGRIIFASGALAAFTASSATWTNSYMGSGDTVIFNVNSGTLGKYTVSVVASNGQGQIVVYNASNASINEVVAASFTLIKGSWS